MEKCILSPRYSHTSSGVTRGGRSGRFAHPWKILGEIFEARGKKEGAKKRRKKGKKRGKREERKGKRKGKEEKRKKRKRKRRGKKGKREKKEKGRKEEKGEEKRKKEKKGREERKEKAETTNYEAVIDTFGSMTQRRIALHWLCWLSTVWPDPVLSFQRCQKTQMCASPSAIVIAVALVKNPLISDLFHHILVQSSGIYWFRGSTILWIWFHVDLESTLCGFDWISIISIVMKWLMASVMFLKFMFLAL